MNDEKPDYETDYYCWLMRTAHLLKKRDLDAICDEDLSHLIDEIKGMARMEYREIDEMFRNLLVQLILYNYVAIKDKPIKFSVYEARSKLRNRLDDSENLKVALYHSLQEHYICASTMVAIQKNIRPEILKLPLECPFSLEEVLDYDFLSLK